MVCHRRLPWSAVARCFTTAFVRASVSLKNNTGPRSKGRRDGKRRSVCRYRSQEERPRPWGTRWLLEGSLCGFHDRHDGVLPVAVDSGKHYPRRSEEHTSELQSRENLVC